MILLLNTSSPVCQLAFAKDSGSGGSGDNTIFYETSWEAGRGLAKGLLLFIQQQCEAKGFTTKDITGLVVFKGPGSFTGLRIGITVMNSLAYAHNVSIVGTTGDAWQQEGLTRLAAGENDKTVLPEYGSDAHITKPRK